MPLAGQIVLHGAGEVREAIGVERLALGEDLANKVRVRVRLGGAGHNRVVSLRGGAATGHRLPQGR